MNDDYPERARLQVEIARTRDAVTSLHERYPDAAGISLRVSGADLFVMRGGALPVDHVLCDLHGRAIAEVPGYRNHDHRAAVEHARQHRGGAKTVVTSMWELGSGSPAGPDPTNCGCSEAGCSTTTPISRATFCWGAR